MQSLLLFSGWFFSLASGPPRTLAPLILTPRQLRHRLAGLHVHQLSREHHGRRHVVVLEPVVGAVRVGVVVKILGCFVNFKLATLVLRLVRTYRVTGSACGSMRFRVKSWTQTPVGKMKTQSGARLRKWMAQFCQHGRSRASAVANLSGYPYAGYRHCRAT